MLLALAGWDFSRATPLYVELGGAKLDGARFIGKPIRFVELNNVTSLLHVQRS